jgi:catechol 2,3-dioxygenase-like lactoylglutathione lyase family enzyme
VFDHVTLRAGDLEASVAFYRTLLGTLGIEPTHASSGCVEWDDFSIMAADEQHPPTRHLHLGFGAASRAEVDRAWQAAIAAGHRDDGAPGERPVYSPAYYGAFLLDPDGNSAEPVHHEDIRRGGFIDTCGSASPTHGWRVTSTG